MEPLCLSRYPPIIKRLRGYANDVARYHQEIPQLPGHIKSSWMSDVKGGIGIDRFLLIGSRQIHPSYTFSVFHSLYGCP